MNGMQDKLSFNLRPSRDAAYIDKKNVAAPHFDQHFVSDPGSVLTEKVSVVHPPRLVLNVFLSENISLLAILRHGATPYSKTRIQSNSKLKACGNVTMEVHVTG